MEIDTIYCGDNCQLIKQLADAAIDLTVTSPPYDNLRTYQGYSWDFETLARELYRVTKPGGVVVWVVGDATIDGSETGTSFKQALFFKGCGFNLHDTMIYKPKGTGAKGSNAAYWQSFEYMFVFSKTTPKTFNPIVDKKAHFAGMMIGSGEKYTENTGRNSRHIHKEVSRRDNVWEYLVGMFDQSDKTNHPAPFPEALARDHILSWSNPGDLVLDPFMGSGTTAKMAKETGRHFIGFEISEDYCKIARKRVAGANVPLFNI